MCQGNNISRKKSKKKPIELKISANVTRNYMVNVQRKPKKSKAMIVYRGSQMEFVSADAALISLKSIVFNCHAPSMIQFIGVDRCILWTIVAVVAIFCSTRLWMAYMHYLTNRWKRENGEHTHSKKPECRKEKEWAEDERSEKKIFCLRTDASDFNEPNPTRLRISIKLKHTVLVHKICRQRYRAMGDTLLCCYCCVSFNVLYALFFASPSLTLALSFVRFCLHPNQRKNW